MLCPRCNAKTEVVKIKTGPSGTDRARKCPRHGRFWSIEKLHRWIDTEATGDPPVTRRRPAGSPPVVAGGVGGGVSSGSATVLSLVPGSDVVVTPDQTRVRRKRETKTKEIVVYTARFEAAWAATGKTGSKFEAAQVYGRIGEPEPEALRAAWALWMTSKQWRDGYVLHVSRWLRGRWFEQAPAEPATASDGWTGSPLREFK